MGYLATTHWLLYAALIVQLPGANVDGKRLQKSEGVEINICFTHGETTDVCTSLSLVFLALLPLWCGMYAYIHWLAAQW